MSSSFPLAESPSLSRCRVWAARPWQAPQRTGRRLVPDSHPRPRYRRRWWKPGVASLACPNEVSRPVWVGSIEIQLTPTVTLCLPLCDAKFRKVCRPSQSKVTLCRPSHTRGVDGDRRRRDNGGKERHTATKKANHMTARRARRATTAFSEWLDITLENRGMSGRALAELMGVADEAISRWRTGASSPSRDNVVKMAEALDVDAVRLALTAAVLPPEFAPGVAPYPIPEPTAQRDSVRRQIARIKGLSEDGKEALLKTYDRLIEEAASEEGA